MDKVVAVVILLTVAPLVFGTWALAWRARKKRQAVLAAPEAPQDPGALRLEQRVLYLATTRADNPLERIAVAGLGFRADAVLRVHETGVALELAGSRGTVFLPVSRLVGAGHANWTIDRGTGGDRLVVLRWRLGEGEEALEVDTVVRGHDPAALVAAIEPLLPVPAASAAGESA